VCHMAFLHVRARGRWDGGEKVKREVIEVLGRCWNSSGMAEEAISGAEALI
jgi:hypothetical protein